MARIPDEVIEQIRDAADLLEIVQETVALKRTGGDWRGPCPFHHGTNRNFAVIPKKNRYYCFVCHASGDVFTWYRERFGLDYPGAVREVARRYGIAIPESAERSGPDPREPLFQACDAAEGWYARQLLEMPEADRARRYLAERDVSLDAAAELRLGYAPRGGEFLAAMRTLGIPDAVLVEAGLAMEREDHTVVSRFRGRLLFPIHDLRGRVVAFGGRILGAGEPKYLNSPETPIFHKSDQLYHLFLAKNAIRKAGQAILVEGYFDVQRLALAGVDHVVAPLGTSLTEAQAALLQRYTADVIVLYDSDTPGLKATFRAADVLLAHGIRVRVATLPEGEDPDTLVRKGGAPALAAILDDAVDVLDRKLEMLAARGWLGDMHRAREAFDRLLSTVRAARDPVMRELYITRVAERLGIPREAVATEATVPAPPPHITRPPTGAVDRRDSRPVHRTTSTPGAAIERKLLQLLLVRPAWLARARAEVPVDAFAMPAYRQIFDALRALPDDAPAGDAFATLDPASREVWDRLLQQDPPDEQFDADRAYVDALEALAEIRSFADIAAEPDPVALRRRWSALSKEGQARFKLYLATSPVPRAATGPLTEE